MAKRYEVTDEQWEVLQTCFGNSPKQTGRPQSDNRKLLNGVLWILHTGAPWWGSAGILWSMANGVQAICTVAEER